jgi:hypothetical protein
LSTSGLPQSPGSAACVAELTTTVTDVASSMSPKLQLSSCDPMAPDTLQVP